MYLVPKRLYDKFINSSSGGTKDMVNQINNVDVSGGQVTINNDCNSDSSVIEKPVSEPLSSDLGQENVQEITEKADSLPDLSSSSTTPLPGSSFQPALPPSPLPDETDQNETKIYVLNQDGVKEPKIVQTEKLSDVDWIDGDPNEGRDLFVDKNTLRMQKGSRKRFNRKAASAPSFLKRNLTTSLAKEMINDNVELKQAEDFQSKPQETLSFSASKPASSLKRRLDSDDVRTSPRSKKRDGKAEPRLKVVEVGSEIPEIVDLPKASKPVKRKAVALEEGPSSKETKDKINLRKRLLPDRRKEAVKKVKLDWSDE